MPLPQPHPQLALHQCINDYLAPVRAGCKSVSFTFRVDLTADSDHGDVSPTQEAIGLDGPPTKDPSTCGLPGIATDRKLVDALIAVGKNMLMPLDDATRSEQHWWSTLQVSLADNLTLAWTFRNAALPGRIFKLFKTATDAYRKNITDVEQAHVDALAATGRCIESARAWEAGIVAELRNVNRLPSVVITEVVEDPEAGAGDDGGAPVDSGADDDSDSGTTSEEEEEDEDIYTYSGDGAATVLLSGTVPSAQPVPSSQPSTSAQPPVTDWAAVVTAKKAPVSAAERAALEEARRVTYRLATETLDAAGWPAIVLVTQASRNKEWVMSKDGLGRQIRPYVLAQRVCAAAVVHTLVELTSQQQRSLPDARPPALDDLEMALNMAHAHQWETLHEMLPAAHATFHSMVGQSGAPEKPLDYTAEQDAAEPGAVSVLEDAHDRGRIMAAYRAADRKERTLAALDAEPSERRLRKYLRAREQADELQRVLDAEAAMEWSVLERLPPDALGPALPGARTALAWNPRLRIGDIPQSRGAIQGGGAGPSSSTPNGGAGPSSSTPNGGAGPSSSTPTLRATPTAKHPAAKRAKLD
jgi:hypothetical protein